MQVLQSLAEFLVDSEIVGDDALAQLTIGCLRLSLMPDCLPEADAALAVVLELPSRPSAPNGPQLHSWEVAKPLLQSLLPRLSVAMLRQVKARCATLHRCEELLTDAVIPLFKHTNETNIETLLNTVIVLHKGDASNDCKLENAVDVVLTKECFRLPPKGLQDSLRCPRLE